MSAPVVYLATLDTRHFEFRAIGRTEREARAALCAAWAAHAEQCGASLAWDELADDVVCSPLEIGAGYRYGTTEPLARVRR